MRFCGEGFREDGVAGSCRARYRNTDSIDFCNVCMLGIVSGPQGGGDERFEIVKVCQRRPSLRV